MTVAEYESKFTQLVRFVTYVIPTETQKVRKFEAGLDVEIKDRLEVLKLPTYTEVVDRAYITEKGIKASHSGEPNHKKRFWERDNRRPNVAPPKKVNTGTTSLGHQGPTNSRGDTLPICRTCGKAHWGQCHRDIEACFKCDQVGHLLRDCPKMTDSTASPSGPIRKPAGPGGERKDQKRQGRAFALVPGKSEVIENVVLGTLSVCGHLVHVLIDSGSTHFFVTPYFAAKLASTPKPLGHILSMSFPSNKTACSTDVYRSCAIFLKAKPYM
ncbi:uncharacterized protein LOC114259742 [Camellia sinensis]|uniref:uncharacterized protein LOC114259742 n=1 Tax=Camellia sinensis TaxID=4442 RepID=UPI001035B32D|nr:uncharacterized protein LOC114259742 [Camellia sinensis]